MLCQKNIVDPSITVEPSPEKNVENREDEDSVPGETKEKIKKRLKIILCVLVVPMIIIYLVGLIYSFINCNFTGFESIFDCFQFFGNFSSHCICCAKCWWSCLANLFCVNKKEKKINT